MKTFMIDPFLFPFSERVRILKGFSYVLSTKNRSWFVNRAVKTLKKAAKCQKKNEKPIYLKTSEGVKLINTYSPTFKLIIPFDLIGLDPGMLPENEPFFIDGVEIS